MARTSRAPLPLALCLALVACLGATHARADDAHETLCEDARESCRETCTLRFGTTPETRGRLLSCLQACEAHARSCRAHRPPPDAPDAGL